MLLLLTLRHESGIAYSCQVKAYQQSILALAQLTMSSVFLVSSGIQWGNEAGGANYSSGHLPTNFLWPHTVNPSNQVATGHFQAYFIMWPPYFRTLSPKGGQIRGVLHKQVIISNEHTGILWIANGLSGV